MPTCRGLAKDILSCAPGFVREYKRLIEAGYKTTLAEGLELEKRNFDRHAPRFTAEVLAARAREMVERGRRQS